jgi:hypothetical protein
MIEGGLMMRVKIILTLVLVLLPIGAAHAQKPGQLGQFQAMPLNKGDALILDTTNGNVWHWMQVLSTEGKTTEVLRYEGQAQPQMSFVDGKPVPQSQ